MAALPASVDAHKDQHVRRLLTPLGAMAGRTSAAVLVVRHLNKMSGGFDPAAVQAWFRGESSDAKVLNLNRRGP